MIAQGAVWYAPSSGSSLHAEDHQADDSVVLQLMVASTAVSAFLSRLRLAVGQIAPVMLFGMILAAAAFVPASGPGFHYMTSLALADAQERPVVVNADPASCSLPDSSAR
jgi:hypothetical protein